MLATAILMKLILRLVVYIDVIEAVAIIPARDPVAPRVAKHLAIRRVEVDADPLEVPEHVIEEAVARSGAEVAVVVSRHEMRNPRPMFTVHTPGLVDEARLAIGHPRALAGILAALAERAPALGMEAWIEATHHTPTPSVPTVFAEVGSTLAEWGREDLARALAEAIEDGLSRRLSPRVVASIGDLHYSELSREAAEGVVAPCHVVNKSARIDEAVVEAAVMRCAEKPQAIVIHWKNVKAGARQAALRVAEKLGVAVEKRK